MVIDLEDLLLRRRIDALLEPWSRHDGAGVTIGVVLDGALRVHRRGPGRQNDHRRQRTGRDRSGLGVEPIDGDVFRVWTPGTLYRAWMDVRAIGAQSRVGGLIVSGGRVKRVRYDRVT